MAIRESKETLRKSGWSVTVVAHDDVSGWVDEVLAVERKRLEGNMRRALAYVVKAIQKTLDRQYPLIRSGANLTGVADPAMRALRKERGGRDRRQSSPPGAPPGKIMGDLQDSWQVGRVAWNAAKNVLTGRYFSDHPGAAPHEFGAPAGTGVWVNGLPSRPYVRPTLGREGEAIGRIMTGDE